MSYAQQHYNYRAGDDVVLPGLPVRIVRISGVSACPEGRACALGWQVLNFVDPDTGMEDWVHASEVRRAAIVR